MKKRNVKTTTCKLRATGEKVAGSGNARVLRIQAMGGDGSRGRSRGSKQRNVMQEGVHLLEWMLQMMIDTPNVQDSFLVATIVSALANAKIAQMGDLAELLTADDDTDPETDGWQGLTPAESVVEFDDCPNLQVDLESLSTEKSVWRRKMEKLWRDHLAKDEYHRPVVKNLGIPVMVVVDHVRKGFSWDTICDKYVGMTHEDVRACLSIATELGWTGQDLD
ncbi:MAG: DUF433 domain-containing protein [bacterium]